MWCLYIYTSILCYLLSDITNTTQRKFSIRRWNFDVEKALKNVRIFWRSPSKFWCRSNRSTSQYSYVFQYFFNFEILTSNRKCPLDTHKYFTRLTFLYSLFELHVSVEIFLTWVPYSYLDRLSTQSYGGCAQNHQLVPHKGFEPVSFTVIMLQPSLFNTILLLTLW